ncbi:MAG: ParA family protein [Oligoflexia bacterium]|nr:ParA family protein [Oligoflexia bacterium]
MSATIISLANQKGGVGKTTSAFNLASALSKLGQKTLLIDNDPQGNLTSYAAPQTSLGLTIDEVYLSRRGHSLDYSALQPLSDTLHLLPADNMLAGVEYYLVSRPDKESILSQALVPLLERFDYVVIDNPPALGLLTINGLMASDYVLIPVQLEYFSLEGIVLLSKTLETMIERNPKLKILGILPNMFDDRRKLNLEVLGILENQFGDKVLKSKIHNSVKISESSGHGKSIFSYSPNSRASQEFMSLAKEVMGHVQNKDSTQSV